MAQHPEAAAWCWWQCKALPLAATCSVLPSCDLKFTCKGWQTDSSQSGRRTDSFHKHDNTPACLKSVQYCLNPPKRFFFLNVGGWLLCSIDRENTHRKMPMNKILRDTFQSRVMTLNRNIISLQNHKYNRLTGTWTGEVALSLTSSEKWKNGGVDKYKQHFLFDIKMQKGHILFMISGLYPILETEIISTSTIVETGRNKTLLWLRLRSIWQWETHQCVSSGGWGGGGNKDTVGELHDLQW